VLYVEPHIEPQLYAERLGGIEQVTRTMLAGFAEGVAQTGGLIEVGALISLNTDDEAELAEPLARLACSLAGNGVASFGTAGFVEPGNLGRFTALAEMAHAAGLSVVCHAGQTGGPDSIEEALDSMHADRIAHGFRAVESPALLDRLSADGIVLDVCPVSNVRLGVVASLEAHPGPQLVAAGVAVTLNADDQLWFGASITDQYSIARSTWGIDDGALATISAAGMRAIGMSDETRRRYELDLREWLIPEAATQRRTQ
jgi:adenosine deaminase